MTRHFLTIDGLGADGLLRVCDLATSEGPSVLAHDEVALVFERPSLRTRAAASTAVHDLGGNVTFFSDDEIGIDTRESAEDVGRTLAQMFAVAGLRVRRHGALERIRRATNDSMAIVNLMSDLAHPTQAVADLLTMADYLAGGDVRGLAGVNVAYVGDVTNVARSLAVALLSVGANVTLGAPGEYQLAEGGIEDPRAVGGALRLTDSAYDAVKDADVVYTDVWVSMGLEAESERRRIDLDAFRVDDALLAVASPGAVVLHCLPAHRGDEITDDVLDGPQSVVWRQVFHRRSAMRGALRWIKEEPR
jgi:ornithine carbamoyltransferase